jgi:hypothetical protein
MKLFLIILVSINLYSQDKWNKEIYNGNKSYSEYSTNIIKDNYTELLWEKKVIYQKYKWKNAQQYCKNLTVDGYKGWRLPSKKELLSLVDRTKQNPAIDTDYFNIRKKDFYWTSTKYPHGVDKAWAIDFTYGEDMQKHINSTFYIRCVK